MNFILRIMLGLINIGPVEADPEQQIRETHAELERRRGLRGS
jgi:hypothetical protein